MARRSLGCLVIDLGCSKTSFGANYDIIGTGLVVCRRVLIWWIDSRHLATHSLEWSFGRWSFGGRGGCSGGAKVEVTWCELVALGWFRVMASWMVTVLDGAMKLVDLGSASWLVGSLWLVSNETWPGRQPKSNWSYNCAVFSTGVEYVS